MQILEDDGSLRKDTSFLLRQIWEILQYLTEVPSILLADPVCYSTGNICADIIKQIWAPVLRLNMIFILFKINLSARDLSCIRYKAPVSVLLIQHVASFRMAVLLFSQIGKWHRKPISEQLT